MFESKIVKFISGAVVACAIVGIGAYAYYNYESDKLVTNLSNNINQLNIDITSFNNGLKQQNQLTNASFGKEYNTRFLQLENDIKSLESNFLNSDESLTIEKNGVMLAQYYGYMSEFTQASLAYKDDFSSAMSVINNGGKLNAEQSTKLQNDLQALENNASLNNAINLYDNNEVYMNLLTTSPNKIKQNLIDLQDALKKPQSNSNTKSYSYEIVNFI